MKKLIKSLKIYFLGGIFLGLIIILIPLIVEKIFWSWSENDSIDITKYIFISYFGFFIVFIRIIIPLIHKISRLMKLKKRNIVDGIATILIVIISLIPLILLRFLVIFLLQRKTLDKYKYKIFNYSIVIALFLLGVIIKTHGEINQLAKIFPINHSSPFDYLFMPLSMGIKPYNIIVGKNLPENKTTTEDKIVSWALGKIFEKDSILVDRDDPASKAAALLKTVREINAKKRIMFSPEEGRIPKSDIKKGMLLKDFGELSDGTFSFAFKRNISIQPIVFDWPVIYRGKGDDWWGIHPCTIDIYYLDAINPRNYNSMEHFKKICFKVMENKLISSKNVQRFLKELKES